MDLRFDLHVHSSFSDGLYTPEEVIGFCVEQNIGVIALCDHDTASGVERCQAAGAQKGVKVIPGIEFSTISQGKKLHILGYGMDFTDPVYLNFVESQREARTERNREVLEKLDALGLPVKERLQDTPVSSLGRAHMARALVTLGAVSSSEEAFARFLGPGGKAYVPRKKCPPEEALRVITACGGKPGLAHPCISGLNTVELLSAEVRRMKDWGLEAIEAYYPQHSEENVKDCLACCDAFGCFPTFGSDFHGDDHGPALCLGWREDFRPESIRFVESLL